MPAAPAAARGGRRTPATQAALSQYPKVNGAIGEFINGLKPVAGKPNTFTASAHVMAWPEGATAQEREFSPLYKIHDTSYMIYVDRAE